MNQKGLIIYSTALILLCASCSQTHTNESKVIDYGELTFDKNASDIIHEDIDFIKLETNDKSMIGYIDQIVFFENQIYILDIWISKSLYIFDLNGEVDTVLVAGAGGPGEFLIPYNFNINEEKRILAINDIAQRKIVTFDIEKRTFIQSTSTQNGYNAIHRLPASDLYAVYKPALRNTDKQDAQILIVDTNMVVQKGLLEADPRSCILSGRPFNFYEFESKLVVLPFFSDILYNVYENSVTIRYNLKFGSATLPPIDFFKELEWGTVAINNKLKNEPYINRIEPFETSQHLLVQYRMGEDYYVGLYNKNNGKIIHTSLSKINDDIHIGGMPTPIGVSGNKIIGVIHPSELLAHKESIITCPRKTLQIILLCPI